MPIQSELWSPIYLPLDGGYKSEKLITWSGKDSENLVHDLQLLNAGQGSGEDLQQTLTIGNDAGGLNIDNLNVLDVLNITSPADLGISVPGQISIAATTAFNMSGDTISTTSATSIEFIGLTFDVSSITGNTTLNDKIRSNIPTYANNGAALAGGLTATMWYVLTATNAVTVVV